MSPKSALFWSYFSEVALYKVELVLCGVSPMEIGLSASVLL